MSRFNRLLRFTVVLILIIFFISHKIISKKQYQHVLDLQSKLANTKYDINSQLNIHDSASQEKIIYKDSTNDLKNYQRANATFFTLAKNEDLIEMGKTIRSVEDRFNKKFHYDWIFFNNQEFSPDFKRTMNNLCSGNVKFEIIPQEFWSYPDWIDKERAKQVRISSRTDIIYGGSETYRFMCRFFSGFFYKLESLQKYDYAWRVEPETTFHCDINYDVFQYMVSNNKHYGFTISLHEFANTIPTLWENVKKFIEFYPHFINPNNLIDFLSDDHGETYNLCHFWTNFEIVNLNFLRSEAYETFFNYLDKANGFFYERWGDAPVHSIAVALFLNKEQIHYFEDIGYYHKPASNCPINDDVWKENNCLCDQWMDVTFRPFSCTPKFYDLLKLKKPDNWKEHAAMAQLGE
ncbi:glycosyltransferase family 15 protein [Wickerhamomyces anomalus NRRL Y-366-8]|uniref:Glycosyltransferase family 15 protein n=1 Tax=Wickerhamomyces anomalus (strain ATCC 58044 / CBS 1984 / NCYC 433 / NRRL Y-366-8) TaxID=683960 RepID=A0A1E3NZ10_WICAA|nr:glycosyltransferase family 15 protein [Wickerhamomyces anomalus NRRL Y-366-8]ODQ58461.1 glycosyltransferase family 15 protein [Wickerhamomyces anomalus NRRL Y-366-8]